MSLMNVRLMVVEDEAEVREKYRKLISGHPMLHFVAETDNADEALHILQTTTIDAVILDLEMSQGSGIFFLSELRMLKIEKPFIAVVTNVVSKTIYDAVRHMGGGLYLRKRRRRIFLGHAAFYYRAYCSLQEDKRGGSGDIS